MKPRPLAGPVATKLAATTKIDLASDCMASLANGLQARIGCTNSRFKVPTVRQCIRETPTAQSAKCHPERGYFTAITPRITTSQAALQLSRYPSETEFRTCHALPLSFGRFLCPEHGRRTAAQCPRQMHCVCPRTRKVRGIVLGRDQSTDWPGNGHGHVPTAANPRTRSCPGLGLSAACLRPWTVHSRVQATDSPRSRKVHGRELGLSVSAVIVAHRPCPVIVRERVQSVERPCPEFGPAESAATP